MTPSDAIPDEASWDRMTWDERWRTFEAFCASVDGDGHADLAAELRSARSYVNGLTDGWEDFLARVRVAAKAGRDRLPSQRAAELRDLLRRFERCLRRR